MANQRRSINEDLIEAVFKITLENLKDFQRFETEEFFVCGNPWRLVFWRKNKSTNKDALGVFLYPNFKHASENTYVIASCELNLLSWKPHVKANCHHHFIGFSSKDYSWVKSSFISWNQLMDQEKGYVMDDKCKFKFKIVATPLQDRSKEDWMKFETIRSCDNCLQRKFRMKINKFSEFGGVVSPAIVFNDLSFGIAALRHENTLCIGAYERVQKSCSASFAFSLISFGANIEPLKVEYKNQKFSMFRAEFYKLVEWEQLTDPTKNFIQNDSFVIEIDMIVELDEPKAKERRQCEANECVSLSCPICFENLKSRPVSSLICGHMF